jgi:hypothetical protein
MKRFLVLLAFLVVLPQPAFAALSAAMVWEVRSTGSNTNGGAFKAGATGTDWTQQDAAQYSVTDGQTAGTTTIISATANFGTDVVGNAIYVQGGTGSITAGWYEITARTNATTITVDRATGLTAGTGVTLKIGGALATIGQLATNMVAQNTGWIKKTGGYTTATQITFNQAGGINTVSQVHGYDVTRGDRGQPVLSVTGAVQGITITGSMFQITDINVDGTNTATRGISHESAQGGSVIRCYVKRCISRGISCDSGLVIECEVTQMTSAGSYGIVGGTTIATVRGCYVHDNACSGIYSLQSVSNCLVVNNTGATSDGISLAGSGSSATAVSNTVYGNGGNGISVIYPNGNECIRNNLVVNNGAKGLYASGYTNVVNSGGVDRNAIYNNTTGNYSGYSAGPNDVTITGDPFTNAAGGDFSLNNTSGRGAALRGTGYPGLFPGSSTTGYLDIGAVQHADSGITVYLVRRRLQ